MLSQKVSDVDRKCPNARFSLQEYLLASVRILRERGAAWVYLVYSAPSAVSQEEVRGISVIQSSSKELNLSSILNKTSIYQT